MCLSLKEESTETAVTEIAENIEVSVKPEPTEVIVVAQSVKEEILEEVTPTEIIIEEEDEDGNDENELVLLSEPENIVEEVLYGGLIPLTASAIKALEDACEENGIPFHIGLGLIDLESEFNSDAISKSGCYGLCQLNPRYFPSDLSDEDNIKYGMEYLGSHYKKYNDWSVALNAYNKGQVTGDTVYPNAVLSRAKKWKEKLAEAGFY